MGKSRVAPLKQITIPRLELSAALVAVKVSTMLNVELSYKNIVDIFWTDSTVVLGYISNDSKRFQVFVANRVQQIRNVTSLEQWNYVESEDNPADDASRGLTAEQLVGNIRWLKNIHEKIGHQGRGMTLNELRAKGYWIIGGSSAVGYHISNCVTCQKCRGNVQEQKMANLPKDRTESEAPFTYCGIDYFGPWHIKGRKELKRYGVLFTCL